MDLAKLRSLENTFDVCSGGKTCNMDFVYDAKTPRGKCPMMKVLMTNKCHSDCKYCSNSVSARKTNISFTPEELAGSFLKIQKDHQLEGFFLSSGLSGDSVATTDKMIETVKMVRDGGFSGYIHFKVLPGASYDQLKEVAPIVDRMSINIEAPNKSRLNELSTVKDYKIDILRRQAWIKRLHGNQTTQLIVGANDESDLEILKMVDWEYKSFELKRIYYSAFKSVEGIPLKKKSESMVRQNHLYNVDFLLRKYDYKFSEFKEIMDDGMLPAEDPKLALAKLNFDGAIEVNEADYEELLRVPGIGPIGAENIIEKRKQGRIKRYSELQQIGVRIANAKPFLKVDDKWQKRLVEFC